MLSIRPSMRAARPRCTACHLHRSNCRPLAPIPALQQAIQALQLEPRPLPLQRYHNISTDSSTRGNSGGGDPGSDPGSDPWAWQRNAYGTGPQRHATGASVVPEEMEMEMDELSQQDSADAKARSEYERAAAAVDWASRGVRGVLPWKVPYARAVPASPSYFSRNPRFNEVYLRLERLKLSCSHLPVTGKPKVANNKVTAPAPAAGTDSAVDPAAKDATDAALVATSEEGENEVVMGHQRAVWKNFRDYCAALGEEVPLPRFNEALRIAKRLQRIRPELRPELVDIAIADFLKPPSHHDVGKKVRVPDADGRAYGIGRRKTSVARVWVVEGTGEVLVNGKPLNQVFGRVHDRESAIWPLMVTKRSDKYNVWGLVEGGGTTGQAEALTMAIGRALVVHEPGLSTSLRRGEFIVIEVILSIGRLVPLLTLQTAGCLTRDPRMVERKKPGRLKARKMPTWVKR